MSQLKPVATLHVVVWAIRRDWPDLVHEFIRPHGNEQSALRALEADRRYWRLGPMRPSLSIVEVGRREVELHGRRRRNCKAPDCPVAAAGTRVVS